MAKQHGYDDAEPTEEELKALREDASVPPPDDADEVPAGEGEQKPEGKSDEAPQAEAQPKKDEEPSEAAPAGEEKPKEEEPSDEDKELAAFLEKHKDKSPQDLARLAFQQSKRANRGEAEARTTKQRLDGIAERLKAASERRQTAETTAVTRKSEFRERLKTDPDAATAEIHDRLVDDEVEAARLAEDGARLDQALEFGASHIPDFMQVFPEMKSLANEIGYSDDEINGIRDGRDLVTLSLARLSANAIKAGLMDIRGNIILPSGEADVTDPRLKAPDAPPGLGGAARPGGGGATLEQKLTEIGNMSDAELDKLDPAVVEDLLRQADG